MIRNEVEHFLNILLVQSACLQYFQNKKLENKYLTVCAACLSVSYKMQTFVFSYLLLDV